MSRDRPHERLEDTLARAAIGKPSHDPELLESFDPATGDLLGTVPVTPPKPWRTSLATWPGCSRDGGWCPFPSGSG